MVRELNSSHVVTDDYVAVDERYFTLETPCHRIATKFVSTAW